MKTEYMLDMLARVGDMAETLEMHEVQSHIFSAERAIRMALRRNAKQLKTGEKANVRTEECL